MKDTLYQVAKGSYAIMKKRQAFFHWSQNVPLHFTFSTLSCGVLRKNDLFMIVCSCLIKQSLLNNFYQKDFANESEQVVERTAEQPIRCLVQCN